MASSNPDCLKLDLDSKKQKRGDFFVEGIDDDFKIIFSPDPDFDKNKKTTVSLSFDIKVKDDSNGNDPIKPAEFEFNENDALQNKKIIYLELTKDEHEHFFIDVKQIPKIELSKDQETREETLSISLLLFNYWLGGETGVAKEKNNLGKQVQSKPSSTTALPGVLSDKNLPSFGGNDNKIGAGITITF
jgi:hypothetical protein